MGKEKYDPAIKETVDPLLLADPRTRPGQMFGYPAYYIGKKMFACLYEDELGIKLPADLAEELVNQEGIDWFQPSGRRKMKEWISLRHADPKEYAGDEALLKRSMEFVAGSD